MPSHKNTPENIPETINFSEEEKKVLKIFIQEKIRNLDTKNSMRVGLFFNELNLLPMPHLPYSMENVEKWNNFIIQSKNICIEKLRMNAAHMSKVYPEKFYEFLQILIDLKLIDISSLPKELSTECLKHTLDKLNQILDPNNPTE